MKTFFLILLLLFSFQLANAQGFEGQLCCDSSDEYQGCRSEEGLTCKCLPDNTPDPKCLIEPNEQGRRELKQGKAGICAPSGKEVICPFSHHLTFESIIHTLVSYIFWIAIVICPLIIVVGAFLFLTSAGDPSRTKKGKDLIKWAVIGLAVIVFSKITSVIIQDVIIGSP